MPNRIRYILYHHWGDESLYYADHGAGAWVTHYQEKATRYKTEAKAEKVRASLPVLPLGYQWYVRKV